MIGAGYGMLCALGYVAKIHIDSAEPAIVEDYFRAASFRPVLTMSSCILKRKALAQVGGFPVDERWGEDPEVEAKLALNYEVVCHPQVTAIYHREIETSAMGHFASEGVGLLPPVAKHLDGWQEEFMSTRTSSIRFENTPP